MNFLLLSPQIPRALSIHIAWFGPYKIQKDLECTVESP